MQEPRATQLPLAKRGLAVLAVLSTRAKTGPSTARRGLPGWRGVLTAFGLVAVSTVSVVTMRPAPADAAVDFSSTWAIGPNTPDFEVAYWPTAFPNMDGRHFKTYFYGGSWYDSQGVLNRAEYIELDTDSSAMSTDLPATIEAIGQTYLGGPGWELVCTTTCAQGLNSFTITYNWVGTGRSAACIDAWNQNPVGPRNEACPRVPINWTQTRQVVAGKPAENQPPQASFTAVPSSTDPYEFTFANSSTDAEDGPADLTYLWEFIDGDTSTERNPTYRFERAGTHTVTLTVTDSDGATSVTSREVVVAAGLEVNSTADRPAEDPAEQGCDTGELVDDVPECTLRAAIETANELGGGEISFAIDGGGVPTIALATDLPAVTGPTTIDGTTQPGGWVQITGDDIGLRMQAGPSKITGLAIYEVLTAIFLESGAGHEVVGNHLGTDAAGTTAISTDAGVAISDATDATIHDNVIGSRIGIFGFPGANGLEVEGNAVGVGADRVSPLGEQNVGILVGSPSAVVRDNVVRGEPVAIEVMGPAATGVLVEGNRVGVSGGGTTATGRVGYGIRVDAAPGAKIVDNQVMATGAAAILVAGDKNYEVTDLSIQLDPPSDEEPGTVTGGSATIEGNSIGTIEPASADRNTDIGILTWGGAAQNVIEGNTVARADDAAIEVLGGSQQRVRGNTIGVEGPVDIGIRIDQAATTTVGGLGDARNEITSITSGIEALGETPGLRIEHNTITAGDGASEHVGVGVSDGAGGVVVNANIIGGGMIGITSDATEAEITGNQVTQQTEVGIRSTGDESTVSGSAVTGGGDGIEVAGTEVDVTLNRVGLQDGSDTVVANTGTGVEVTGGDATLTGNAIAGGTGGIDVGATADAELRANRIWQVAAKPISVADGPDAPVLTAAVRTTSGASTRTTLVVTELPEEDAGKIEVFASDSCTDPEPRYLMDLTRTKKADEKVRIIQIKGNANREHFLVTYTDEEGRTSELSSCADAGTYPDGDGDGSPDPIDGLLDLDDNPAAALVVTDDEQLMMLSTVPFDEETGEGGGTLEDVAVVDDPAAGSHPSGWSLPHGVITFRITGLEPGATTRVLMTLVTDSAPIAGSSYWKYGPATPGAADSWYPFEYDEASGTGAVRLGAQNVPGLGIRDVFALSLRDGARGDHDGGMNGTITDPGGPVIGAGQPEPPTSTTTTTSTTSTTSTTTPDGSTTSTTAEVGSSSTTPGSSGQTTEQPAEGELARTGWSSTGPVALGLALLLGGIALLTGRQRQRTRMG